VAVPAVAAATREPTWPGSRYDRRVSVGVDRRVRESGMTPAGAGRPSGSDEFSPMGRVPEDVHAQLMGSS